MWQKTDIRMITTLQLTGKDGLVYSLFFLINRPIPIPKANTSIRPAKNISNKLLRVMATILFTIQKCTMCYKGVIKNSTVT